MQQLTYSEIALVSGGEGDYGREAAQAGGATAGNFLGGGYGAILGALVGGVWYDWASSVAGSNISSVTDPMDSKIGIGSGGGTAGASGGNPQTIDVPLESEDAK